VGAGYLLGRTKKMRLALMIAAAGATGRAGTSPQALLKNGLKQLGASAELGKLTDLARDELLGAAKAAAVTAASSRINSLSDRLQEGKPGKETGEPEDEEQTDQHEQPEEDEQPRRPARRRASSRAQGEDSDDSDEEEPERPVRRRASSRRGSENAEPARRSRSSGRTPVRRAGR